MINYRDIELKEIALIKDLWEMNLNYHIEISPFFKANYSHFTFEGRFDFLNELKHYKITVAKSDDLVMGYIVTALIDGKGEHLSLHVDKNYRGQGIGNILLNNHIKWLDDMECREISIKVSYENTDTIEFYRTQGFMTDTLEMILKKNS